MGCAAAPAILIQTTHMPDPIPMAIASIKVIGAVIV